MTELHSAIAHLFTVIPPTMGHGWEDKRVNPTTPLSTVVTVCRGHLQDTEENSRWLTFSVPDDEWRDAGLANPDVDLPVIIAQLRAVRPAAVYRIKGVHEKPIRAFLMPHTAVERFAEHDEGFHNCKWWEPQGKTRERRTYEYACNRARQSRAKNVLEPQMANKQVVKYTVGEAGAVVMVNPCPFACRTQSDGKVALVMIQAFHNHLASDQHAQLTATLDPSIRQLVVELGHKHQEPQTVWQLCRAIVIKGLTDRGAGCIPFADKRLFPSLSTVERIVRSECTITRRFSDQDAEDVRQLVMYNPGRVHLLQKMETDGASIKQHLMVAIGGAAERRYWRKYVAGGLLMIDATHKFNQFGYRTFTAMAVRRNKRGRVRGSVIVGHLITSDLTAEPIQTWLKFLQQDLEAPAEVLIDVDVTEEKAIRASFPASHVAFCYFHCMKAIMENFRAATPNQKGYAKALFRGLLLTRKRETFDKYMLAIQKLMAQWPEMKQYWESQWEPSVNEWSNVCRKFPDVRTTNFLESFHCFIKHSIIGAHGTFVKRVGDAIRILLDCGAHRKYKHILSASGRLRKSDKEAKEEFERAVEGATKLEKLLRACSCGASGETCKCAYKVWCLGGGEMLFVVQHSSVSYDVNLHDESCTCPDMLAHPERPCKHVIAVCKVLANAEGKNFLFHAETNSRCDCSHDNAARLYSNICQTFTDEECADAELMKTLELDQRDWASSILQQLKTQQLPTWTEDMRKFGITVAVNDDSFSSSDSEDDTDDEEEHDSTPERHNAASSIDLLGAPVREIVGDDNPRKESGGSSSRQTRDALADAVRSLRDDVVAIVDAVLRHGTVADLERMQAGLWTAAQSSVHIHANTTGEVFSPNYADHAGARGAPKPRSHQKRRAVRSSVLAEKRTVENAFPTNEHTENEDSDDSDEPAAVETSEFRSIVAKRVTRTLVADMNLRAPPAHEKVVEEYTQLGKESSTNKKTKKAKRKAAVRGSQQPQVLPPPVRAGGFSAAEQQQMVQMLRACSAPTPFAGVSLPVPFSGLAPFVPLSQFRGM